VAVAWVVAEMASAVREVKAMAGSSEATEEVERVFETMEVVGTAAGIVAWLRGLLVAHEVAVATAVALVAVKAAEMGVATVVVATVAAREVVVMAAARAAAVRVVARVAVVTEVARAEVAKAAARAGQTVAAVTEEAVMGLRRRTTLCKYR